MEDESSSCTMHNQQKVRGTKPLRVSLIFTKTLNFSLLFLVMALIEYFQCKNLKVFCTLGYNLVHLDIIWWTAKFSTANINFAVYNSYVNAFESYEHSKILSTPYSPTILYTIAYVIKLYALPISQLFKCIAQLSCMSRWLLPHMGKVS